jgi:hypothetical protein
VPPKEVFWEAKGRHPGTADGWGSEKGSKKAAKRAVNFEKGRKRGAVSVGPQRRLTGSGTNETLMEEN